MQFEKVVMIVKNHEISSTLTIDQQVKEWVTKDDNIVMIYGWEAEKVEDNVYFVAYVFDLEDSSKDSGWKNGEYIKKFWDID